MAYPAYLREKARSMRSDRRMTLDEITVRLALPRTTIWSWIDDLPVPRAEFDPRPADDARRRAAEANSRRYRLLREAAYERGAAEFEQLVGDPLFRDFVCLYIAEGYKRSRNALAVGNSDPAVVRLCTSWLTRLSSRRLGFSVQHHADQDVEELREFWGAELDIDPKRISFQRKSNSGRLSGRTWRSRYGVLTVRACDTLLRARMQAWMDAIRAGWT